MKSNKIKSIFNNSLKKTSKHYCNLLEDFELEEIHDFRLEIKKLRAFIRLVNTEATKKMSIKIKRRIKTFYNTTGKIRNAQLHKQRIIQLSMTLSLEAPETYLELLNEEGIKEKRKARLDAKEISFLRFKRTLIRSMPEELTTASVQYFTTQKRNELLAFLTLSVYDDETLHNIRKILKDILYDWTYIMTYLASGFPEYLVHKENIESLATKLGDFHDLCVALSFLTPVYIDQIISEAEKDVLMVIKRRMEWEKYNTKEQIALLFDSIKKEIWVENTIRDVCEIL